MRILLDECVDERLSDVFTEHDCWSARYAGLAGLRNGELLDAAEAADFDGLVTVDQNIPDQQNLTSRRLAILILCARTNRHSDLKDLFPAAYVSLRSIQPGQAIKVRR